MYLISNSISGEHISLVVDNQNLKKAVNIVHSQVFGVIKTINLFAFGKGNVGGNLIDQILATPDEVVKRRNLRIRVVGVADSQRYVFNESGLGHNWREELANSKASADCATIIETLESSVLENIVVADNTSSQEIANCYLDFLNHQIDIVASNKKANSGSYEVYNDIRKILKRRGRLFYYETNVGAGLPIIDTLKHLYDSADQVVKLRGVFSGSLSYIFNNFSVRDESFSNILEEAKNSGFTEPNPVEDLLGTDVARKLIILARELGLEVEPADVKMQNLLPEEFAACKDYSDLLNYRDSLDAYYNRKKEELEANSVLRYVAELDIEKSTLSINLEAVDRSTALGSIKNADALFEIFTESYGENPIIIQGAGAGGEVTARGVYSDLIRLGHKY
jgi:aspartokinase/homoserine dehydrogenase 1